MKRFFILLVFIVFSTMLVSAQTPRTLVKTVSTLPATCTAGVPQTDEVFKTGSGAGLYYCSATNTWTLVVTANVPGIFQINGMTGSSQTIAIGTAGTAPNIVSSGDTTTINIPEASSTATGTVTAAAQSISGGKIFLNSMQIQVSDAAIPLNIFGGNAAGSAITNKSTINGASAALTLTNNTPLSLNLSIAGSAVAGNQFTNGPLAASNAQLQGPNSDISIHQFGSDGNIWFATNDTARAKISSAGFTQWGTTSGTSTIKPQAIAGTYAFELPNTDPVVGQVISIDGFTGGTVTLGYSDGGGGSTGLYDLASQVDGLTTPSQKIGSFRAARAFTLAVTGSVCSSDTAATAQTDFLIQYSNDNGTTWVTKGTARFAASAKTCTIVSPSGTSIAIGDRVRILGPATPDATLADLIFTLKSSTPDAAAYDLSSQWNGDVAADQIMLSFRAVRAITVPVTGSVCSADTAATAQTDFVVEYSDDNGATWTSKGTLRFAAAGKTCSVVSPTSISMAIGDRVRVRAPSTRDTTIADLTFSLVGSNP